jgi:hypothetical protein
VIGATHLPGPSAGNANALAHEYQRHCRPPSIRLLQWLPAPTMCRPFLDTKCSRQLTQMMCQTDIMQAAGTDRSTTAELVYRLVQKDLLARRRTRRDARRYAVRLSV